MTYEEGEVGRKDEQGTERTPFYCGQSSRSCCHTHVETDFLELSEDLENIFISAPSSESFFFSMLSQRTSLSDVVSVVG